MKYVLIGIGCAVASNYIPGMISSLLGGVMDVIIYGRIPF